MNNNYPHKKQITKKLILLIFLAVVTGGSIFYYTNNIVLTDLKKTDNQMIQNAKEQDAKKQNNSQQAQNNNQNVPAPDLDNIHYLNTAYGFSVDFNLGSDNVVKRAASPTYTHIVTRDSALIKNNIPVLEFTDYDFISGPNVELIKYQIYKDKSFLSKAKKIQKIEMFGKNAEVYAEKIPAYEYYERVPFDFYIVFNVKNRYLALKFNQVIPSHFKNEKLQNNIDFSDDEKKIAMIEYEDKLEYLKKNAKSMQTFRFLDEATTKKESPNWPRQTISGLNIPIPNGANLSYTEEIPDYFAIQLNSDINQELQHIPFTILDTSAFYKGDPELLTNELFLEAIENTYKSKVEKLSENIYKSPHNNDNYVDYQGNQIKRIRYFVLDQKNKKVILVDYGADPIYKTTFEEILFGIEL